MPMSLESLRESLARGFDHWAPSEGATPGPILGLTFHRHTSPMPPYVGMMDASLSLVIAGEKRVILGDHIFDYGKDHFLLTPIDLPVTARVIKADTAVPYLGILLGIDLASVRSLLARIDPEKIGSAAQLGITYADVTSDVLDALYRLCRFTERPDEIELFAEQARLELLYRLLISPIGSRLSALASIEGPSSGVVRALEWLKVHFRDWKSTEDLADIAGMGASTFHRHFKAITTMTPLQYRKHLQLNEARRLMIVSGVDAASAAYDVGYESPSQFNREYHRTFGQPPAANIASLKRALYEVATNEPF